MAIAADNVLECLCLLSYTFPFGLILLFLYGSFIVVNLFVYCTFFNVPIMVLAYCLVSYLPGLIHTSYLPGHDSGGWMPSNYFSGASSQSLVIAALGPSSSEAAILL